MVSAIVREEREYCCDDQAARAGGGERMMAVALTSLGLVKRGLALGLSAVPTKRGFYRRVIRLIEPAGRPELPVRGLLLGLFGAAALVVLLTQCSRNGASPDSLPVAGDRLSQVLTDNQAGYKEQVFNYTKGGKEHEIFLVRTVDEKQALYAYLDGKRLDPGELSAVMKVVRVRPTVDLVLTEAATFRRDTPVRAERDVARDEVKRSMATYSRDIAMIPLGVEQHRILTRIITSNQYTETDQREVSELIRKRQAMNLSTKEPPPPPPPPPSR
jgi:hypothetical protein